MNKIISKCILIASVTVALTLTVSHGDKRKMILELEKRIESSNNTVKKLEDEIKDLIKDTELYKKEVDELIIKNKELEKKNKELLKARYDSNDLTIKSNITKEQLYNILDGTDMQQLSEEIVSAEKEYGVNSLFLTALIAHETGYGTSRRYREDNNVGGYEVYTVSSKGRIFDSKESSVNAVASLLSSHYLNPEGKYYNGKSSFDVNKLYCQSSPGGQFEWHKTIDSIARNLRDEINKQIQ